MSSRVLITGIGSVSSIGLSIQELTDSIVTSSSGVSRKTRLDSILARTLPTAQIQLSDEELKKRIPGLSSKQVYSRTALLGMLAASEAIANAGLAPSDCNAAGLVNSTSAGGMDKGEIFYADYLTSANKGNLKFAQTHDCGDAAEQIAALLHIEQYITTISTACSSAANAMIHAARLIKAGICDIVIAGGSDAICKFTINGFNSLMILSDEDCKPFDKNRKGLNLGEAAGYFVLESEASVKRRGVKPLAVLSGYGNACDAYHQTASSPNGEGAYLAMMQAIRTSGFEPAEIDYINAHGTGTQNNDLSESVALLRIFTESNLPPVSSTKAMTGHTLAAAGGIEAVLSVLAIQNGWIFPNKNFSEAIEETGIIPVTELQTNKSIKHILSNSFGFGGNNSSLLISAC
ncbi:beta-ketoacyl-[acyl-carrier-protein] synthase family protein [Cytophaga aurantiaca]|uniref:beta-ketoacyl-[acyl-carrier-protein] synthase family protein n=1 Tax=Cytophaga aurantiaca TaxID=29530 RepID=UPI0003807EEA|nr:beta-ketoacyl-[acyl-carrier-protein] synthase family protein [Cytophaga aurantiaca]